MELGCKLSNKVYSNQREIGNSNKQTKNPQHNHFHKLLGDIKHDTTEVIHISLVLGSARLDSKKQPLCASC